MKIALYIEDGLEQIVLTPHWQSYAYGGSSGADESTMIVLRPTPPPEPEAEPELTEGNDQ